VHAILRTDVSLEDFTVTESNKVITDKLLYEFGV
jgi:hypothetical protein